MVAKPVHLRRSRRDGSKALKVSHRDADEDNPGLSQDGDVLRISQDTEFGEDTYYPGIPS